MARLDFRHASLAEAVYTTILPAEREELHARLAGELARSAAAALVELRARHQLRDHRGAPASGTILNSANSAAARCRCHSASAPTW